ncbi:MAG: hypothetical protein GC180_10830 [Bacteroidetes bacterium]|nr:hypothetical protein [Bacteroidota bacterium]
MKKILTLIILSFAAIPSFSQEEDDLLNMIEKQDSNKVVYTTATFKGTRLINLPTVEVMGKNTLEFRIAHRFGDAFTKGSRAQNLYGLDGPVALNLSLDYSLSDRFSFGIARTNIQKLVTGNVKYRLLRQTTNNKMPISVTYEGKMNVTHEKNLDKRYDLFSNRLSYVNHLLIARKFNSSLSLQVDLMHIHRNLVQYYADKNTMFAIGLSGRMKVTKRLAITAEYAKGIGHYAQDQSNFYDHLGVGVDIETGGHVFQLFVVNSFTLNEVQFIPANDRSIGSGALRFGFNVSRVFSYS